MVYIEAHTASPGDEMLTGEERTTVVPYQDAALTHCCPIWVFFVVPESRRELER